MAHPGVAKVVAISFILPRYSFGKYCGKTLVSNRTNEEMCDEKDHFTWKFIFQNQFSESLSELK